ncbi:MULTISPECIES: M24 family metallopeptidase [unclassified Pseudomonas]|uniref:M24 family metallopeptidase n=1 Tax=unclassified Pseudomonas TaxID=196821 RepID=UPI000BD5793B|nr:MULTISPECIES: M24 family metallopeptidase [unclassified Pseudomonas]PVZ11477.1 metallopeptidase family M24 [Pseudomonas sp. URIL14HWK12:I12]PVZ22475.1 metallopeptidase family M24 [Pseudomonas sp. URIL14HWK12:I10]PVZ31401.1 metallopeptidase family M24 [Pseudomonas sp. URIL14HWK12:I11]SNZ16164.1 Xaa-Pro aminopeptidase [Pseudomonas sp. URIL14HWK12:I9]
MTAYSKEATGQHYSLAAMQQAQAATWQVIERLAARIEPGMRESDAQAIGKQVLAELETPRIWHPLLVRFGENTLKMFHQRSDGDPVLGEHDIFFIDLGAVYGGHEGDAGASFTTGSDPEMIACAAAAKTLYDEVEARWRSTGATGPQLYDFARERAGAMGWQLNLDIKGHRVSDFPHAIYKAGDLGDYTGRPSSGLWILEIQIRHPSKAYGAFYEDLLV